MKSVAIIGGGSSGLVAAKSMLDEGLLPTIFESSSELGGLWSKSTSKIQQSLRTNISRFSCSFSYFPWSETIKNDNLSTFPTASQMGNYLNEFYNFLLKEKSRVQFNSEVEKINYVEEDEKWSVEYINKSTDIEGDKKFELFDFLIVASGFFTKSYIPKIRGLGESKSKMEIYHSSEAENFLSKNQLHLQNKSIVVVGSSFSGADICSNIATLGGYKDLKHVITKPFWIIPRFIVTDTKSKTPSFLPLDLVFYDISQLGTDKREVIAPTPQDIKLKNTYLKSMLGKQFEISKYLEVSEDEHQFKVVSDTYAEFVRSGKIKLIPGRLHSINGRNLLLEDSEKFTNIEEKEIEDVDIIIFATGFQSEFKFFSEKDLEKISYEPLNLFQPLLLHMNILHPQLKKLGFVGTYRGPFFGVSEFQAEYLSKIFSNALPWPSHEKQLKGIEKELFLRNISPKPQFPHNDYVGILNDLLSEIGEPANYFKDQLLTIKQTELEKSSAGKWIARQFFYGLMGSWEFRRKISSQIQTTPSGHVEGVANLNLVRTQNSAHLKKYDYFETGNFYTESHASIGIKRSYIYEYDGEKDKISIFFNDKTKEEQSLFLCLDFSAVNNVGWVGKGTHVCGSDIYDGEFRLNFRGAYLESFETEYVVKGPSKKYVSNTKYKRREE